MTKVRKDGKQQAVTLLSVVPQKIVRYKSIEKDGYSAVVVGLNPTSKDGKVTYQAMREFAIDEDFSSKYAVGSDLSVELVDGQETVAVRGISKGK
jgi:large subunit ribosomal protein L3